MIGVIGATEGATAGVTAGATTLIGSTAGAGVTELIGLYVIGATVSALFEAKLGAKFGATHWCNKSQIPLT